MAKQRDIIIKLKEVREEKGLSLNEIVTLVEKNGDFISRSSVQRVFSEGSEDVSFRYDDTIRPIANALLDIDTIEDEDELDTKAMKSLLQYKNERIKELEQQLDNEKLKRHEKIEVIRSEYEKKIDFLKEQITLKDKRMGLLLEHILGKEK